MIITKTGEITGTLVKGDSRGTLTGRQNFIEVEFVKVLVIAGDHYGRSLPPPSLSLGKTRNRKNLDFSLDLE